MNGLRQCFNVKHGHMSGPIKLLTQYSILCLPEVDDGKSATDYGHLPIRLPSVERQYWLISVITDRHGKMSSKAYAGANPEGFQFKSWMVPVQQDLVVCEISLYLIKCIRSCWKKSIWYFVRQTRMELSTWCNIWKEGALRETMKNWAIEDFIGVLLVHLNARQWR